MNNFIKRRFVTICNRVSFSFLVQFYLFENLKWIWSIWLIDLIYYCYFSHICKCFALPFICFCPIRRRQKTFDFLLQFYTQTHKHTPIARMTECVFPKHRDHFVIASRYIYFDDESLRCVPISPSHNSPFNHP